MAPKIKKGASVRITADDGVTVTVRVWKREKWSRTKTRLHYVNTGGLPKRRFGIHLLEMTSEFFDNDELAKIELV